MSVFAVPRSIARSREKSLYLPLNMERFEPWAAGERGAGRQQGGQVTQRAQARGYARVPLWSSKGLIGQPAASSAGWSARMRPLTTRSRVRARRRDAGRWAEG